MKPFIEELSALMQFIENPGSCPEFLVAVADINKRKRFHYENRPKSEHVECNEDQDSVIRNLRFNVEAVQGPPGFTMH